MNGLEEDGRADRSVRLKLLLKVAKVVAVETEKKLEKIGGLQVKS